MVTVEFFDNAKVDNAGRMGNFTSLTDQNNYFNGLNPLTISGVRMNNLGDPIEVQSPWTTILGYSYGRFQVNGIWIYFSVDDIEPINDTKTRISYSVDAWETCRHQYGITLGRGKVMRAAKDIGGTWTARPFEPNSTTISVIQSFNISQVTWANDLMAVAVVHDSELNTNWLYVTKGNEFSSLIAYMNSGQWVPWLGITSANDVLGQWLSPWPIDTSPQFGWGNIENTAGDVIGHKVRIDLWNYQFEGSSNLSFPISAESINGTQNELYAITDMRGNAVWTSDVSTYFTDLTLNAEFCVSPSSCHWMCQIGDEPATRFVIPCEEVFLINDAFTEYNVRQKAYDMQLRDINRQQNLVNGLVNSGTSAVGGAIAGAGGGAGAGAGAVAGLALGIITSGIQYAIQPIFDNKIQQATDSYYKRQQDAMILSGSALMDVFKCPNRVCLEKIVTDPFTYLKYDDAVNAGGLFYDNVETSNIEGCIADGPFCADVEVLGSIPSAWKDQIRNRIMNGVIFV